MKTGIGRSLGLMSVLLAAGVLSGCAEDPTEDKTAAVVNEAVEVDASGAAEESTEEAAPAPEPEGTKYVLDTSVSTITFTGSKVTGPHSGGWSEYEGTTIIPDGDFSKAHISINIDMSSTYSDDADLTEKLIGEEFFEVATYPTSTFVSTAIEGSGEDFDVSGNLMLHGVTKNLTFPVLVELSDDKLIAEAEFSFNRKDFGVDYDGKADDLIRDNVLMLFYVEFNVE